MRTNIKLLFIFTIIVIGNSGTTAQLSTPPTEGYGVFAKNTSLSWNVIKFDVNPTENDTISTGNPQLASGVNVTVYVLNDTAGVQISLLSNPISNYFSLAINESSETIANSINSPLKGVGFNYKYESYSETPDYNITAYIDLYFPLIIPLTRNYSNGSIIPYREAIQSTIPFDANITIIDDNYWQCESGAYIAKIHNDTGIVTEIHGSTGVVDFKIIISPDSDPDPQSTNTEQPTPNENDNQSNMEPTFLNVQYLVVGLILLPFSKKYFKK